MIIASRDNNHLPLKKRTRETYVCKHAIYFQERQTKYCELKHATQIDTIEVEKVPILELLSLPTRHLERAHDEMARSRGAPQLII